MYYSQIAHFKILYTGIEEGFSAFNFVFQNEFLKDLHLQNIIQNVFESDIYCANIKHSTTAPERQR